MVVIQMKEWEFLVQRNHEILSRHGKNFDEMPLVLATLRNPYDLAWDPHLGKVVVADNGQTGGDEIHVLARGAGGHVARHRLGERQVGGGIDADIAADRLGAHFTAHFHETWGIAGGTPNGGYLMAIAARAIAGTPRGRRLAFPAVMLLTVLDVVLLLTGGAGVT